MRLSTPRPRIERRIDSQLAPATLFVVLFAALLCLPATSHADTLVVANKSDATVSLVDLETGEVAATVPTGQGPHEVAVSFDGRLAVVTDYGTRDTPGSTLTVIDVVAADVVRTIDLGDSRRPHGILWLDEESVLVTSEDAHALLQVHVGRGEVTRTFDTGQEVSHMVALAAVGTQGGLHAWVANIGSGSVSVVDVGDGAGERVAILETGAGAEGITVSDRLVWVTNREADTVSVFEVESRHRIKEFAAEGFPIRAEATPNGRWVLVTLARAGKLVLYDALDLAVEPRVIDLGVEASDTEDRLFGDRFGDSSVPIGIEVDRSSDRVWIAHANADVVSEHELPSGALRRLLRPGREPDGMAYSQLTLASRFGTPLNDGRGAGTRPSPVTEASDGQSPLKDGRDQGATRKSDLNNGRDPGSTPGAMPETPVDDPASDEPPLNDGRGGSGNAESEGGGAGQGDG